MDTQLFENTIDFPNSVYKEIYDGLVGLNEIKTRIIKESNILLNPKLLEKWSKDNHKSVLPIVKTFENRHALFIFAGDVGTGKTTLAESFGDNLARLNKLNIVLFRLSLNTRGTGAVGEMTRLISSAFMEIKTYAEKIKPVNGVYSSACILLIDEADALAQSRELVQMHHEDKAGVNALIRGIDSLSKPRLPVITIMCTNRLTALDPALRRRAADIFEFHRPNFEQRMFLFQDLLKGVNLNKDEFEEIANLTGENSERKYGHTYSDIVQRILPSTLLNSYPNKPIDYQIIIETIKNTPPTLPFNEQ